MSHSQLPTCRAVDFVLEWGLVVGSLDYYSLN